MFNHSFPHPFGGKYRSATAPIVSSLSRKWLFINFSLADIRTWKTVTTNFNHSAIPTQRQLILNTLQLRMPLYKDKLNSIPHVLVPETSVLAHWKQPVLFQLVPDVFLMILKNQRTFGSTVRLQFHTCIFNFSQLLVNMKNHEDICYSNIFSRHRLWEWKLLC